MPDKIHIKIDRNACGGCLSCMSVCSLVNESYVSPSGARIQVELAPFDGDHRILLCRQCTKAACVTACAEGAIGRDEGGWLVVDYERCTGCRACIEACPFEAMFWNSVSQRVIKCEQCDGDPQCVQACPTGALTIHVRPGRK
jgi:carbon-monoxide dehydrogenase iron sulfur subunit